MKRLLDLFCGAGGAGFGYHCAGFEVVGVDIAFQKHYLFEFHQADALEYLIEHGREFDAIHASPPCQAYTSSRSFHNNVHPELVNPTRKLLQVIGKPFVIENVIGAPLTIHLMLCGTMFGLGMDGLSLYRHRIFESGGGFYLSPFTLSCNHEKPPVSIFGNSVLGKPKPGLKKYRHPNDRQEMGVSFGRIVMKIDWMTGKELSQAIPPAYTEFIGCQIMEYLQNS